ncbi:MULTISPECIES: hypothetical protein [unclassified Microbulbifer]|nr:MULTISPECIES: hypothetical protein [unclassified Microbulbifer]
MPKKNELSKAILASLTAMYWDNGGCAKQSLPFDEAQDLRQGSF